MRKAINIFFIATVSIFILTACNNSGSNKTSEKELELQKRELDLKQKELELKEKELAQTVNKNGDTSVEKKSEEPTKATITSSSKSSGAVEQVSVKCDSKYQVNGKLIEVNHMQDPCSIVYLLVLTDRGKKEELYIETNLDNFKVNDRKFFKWSASKITTELGNDPSQIELPFPKSSFDASLLNRSASYCCYKQVLNCGDDPNSPSSYFCKQILISEK